MAVLCHIAGLTLLPPEMGKSWVKTSFDFKKLLQRNAFLVLRLHGGEQDDLADAVSTGEQHDCTVNTDAHATRGRHTIFHCVQEVLVQHLGLVVTALTLLNLLHKAAALIDGIVQLGVGIAHLAAADEELEAFGEIGRAHV